MLKQGQIFGQIFYIILKQLLIDNVKDWTKGGPLVPNAYVLSLEIEGMILDIYRRTRLIMEICWKKHIKGKSPFKSVLIWQPQSKK